MAARTNTDHETKRVDEEETVLRSPVEVRPGLRGTPVLWVLIVSSLLAVAGLGFLLLTM